MYTIVCFGDTNTWGYDNRTGERLPYHERWTGILNEKLGSEYYVVEEGLAGRTTVNEDPIEQHKCGREHIYPCLLSHEPIDVFVMMLGQVELKSRFSLTAYDIAMGVEELVQIVLNSKSGPHKKAPKIILISPVQVGDISGTNMEHWFPANGTKERSILFPKLFKEITEKYHIEFLEASSVAKTAEDAIHMANESHEDFACQVTQMIKNMVESVSPERSFN